MSLFATLPFHQALSGAGKRRLRYGIANPGSAHQLIMYPPPMGLQLLSSPVVEANESPLGAGLGNTSFRALRNTAGTMGGLDNPVGRPQMVSGGGWGLFGDKLICCAGSVDPEVSANNGVLPIRRRVSV